MSIRYGRNQRRQHREQIAKLGATVEAVRVGLRMARFETDRVRRELHAAPLARIRARAIEILGVHVAELIEKAEDQRLREALTDLSTMARRQAEIETTPTIADSEPATIFRIHLPAVDYAKAFLNRVIDDLPQ